MIDVLVQKKPGPVVMVGSESSGCLVLTKSKDGQLGLFMEGLSPEDITLLLAKAQTLADEMKTWADPVKTVEQDAVNPDMRHEHWKFSCPTQAAMFKQQLILAGLPVNSK